MADCEIRGCGKQIVNLVYVNENIGDGSWRVGICAECAKKLGLKAGDDMASVSTARRLLRRR